MDRSRLLHTRASLRTVVGLGRTQPTNGRGICIISDVQQKPVGCFWRVIYIARREDQRLAHRPTLLHCTLRPPSAGPFSPGKLERLSASKWLADPATAALADLRVPLRIRLPLPLLYKVIQHQRLGTDRLEISREIVTELLRVKLDWVELN